MHESTQHQMLLKEMSECIFQKSLLTLENEFINNMQFCPTSRFQAVSPSH